MHFMQKSALNRVLAASFAAVLATTSLSAIPRDPCEPPAPAVCCEEPRPGPFAFAYPFDMDLSCPRDFYIHADFLYMQARQDGMEFAIDDSSIATTAGPITGGQVLGFSDKGHDFNWNPGMRLGMGFYLDHDAWQLDFNWTWVNVTNYKQRTPSAAGGSVLPQWLVGVGTPQALTLSAQANAKWNADYNTFDISLGKPYYVSRYLVFNPHFGLRGGWIDQRFSVKYYGNSYGTTKTLHHGENDFWGVGGRAGLDTNWILGKGWGLFGNIATSLLCGKFRVDQEVTIPTAAGNTDGFDIEHHYYQNVTNLEMALGICWGKYFNKKRNHVDLKLAYEFHQWFDQFNMRKFFSGSTGIPTAATPIVTGAYANDTVSRGNFTLNGLSFKLQFDI